MNSSPPNSPQTLASDSSSIEHISEAQDADRKALQQKFIDWDKKLRSIQNKIIDTIDARLLLQSEHLSTITDSQVSLILQKKEQQDLVISRLLTFIDVLQKAQENIFNSP
ncbi:hypothetical protein BB559_000415 [Furculomyces boomerangus]|uniref:Uncharacterized protein n=1 Tax=Furculomyces boomerangus TaxID=61424 RepID=A0A2T9Z5B1_9FUNG|nr:hypothetical protein BB559_000415 [Furculomyces boomerangus]